MLEFDGMQTLKQLQSNPKTSHIPIILITAKARSIDHHRFYKAGAKSQQNIL